MNDHHTDQVTDRLVDTRAIIDLTLTYAAAIDHRDWAQLATIFTDPFELDMRSVSGRPPTNISAADWAARVSLLGRLDATQHLITNHLVTIEEPGRRAHCRAEMRAQHWLDPEHLRVLELPADTVGWYELGGHYDFTLQRDGGAWRIAAYALVIRWRTGSEQVFELAERLSRQR